MSLRNTLQLEKWHFIIDIYSIHFWVKIVGKEVKEAHQEARRSYKGTLVKLEIVDVRNYQQHSAITAYSTSIGTVKIVNCQELFQKNANLFETGVVFYIF